MALNSIIYEKSRNAFEQRCYRLLIEAYNTSLTEKAIKFYWDENDISCVLHQYITGNPLRKRWKVSSNIEHHIYKDLPKEKGFSNKFPRIDFRFTTFTKNDEYEYFFEAKNLKINDLALKRRYIKTGIDSFVSKKYENGSLIGYLLEGRPDEIIKSINTLLATKNRQTETLKFTYNRLFSFYYESKHADLGILKHLIFDYTTI